MDEVRDFGPVQSDGGQGGMQPIRRFRGAALHLSGSEFLGIRPQRDNIRKGSAHIDADLPGPRHD